MASFWRALIDFFFPPKCPFCGARSGSDDAYRPCPSCLAQVRFLSPPRCPRCGLAFEVPAEDHLCSDCLKSERPFSVARSIFAYEGLMAKVISRFKYGRVSRLGHILGLLLADYRDPDLVLRDWDLLVPVPLHPRRLRQRGFNQSALLARKVGRRHSVAVELTALRRARHTQPQTQLSGAQRQENIRGAFEVRREEAVSGKKVLLIDDVFTTGATVTECARVLLAAGADRVDVLTLARVIR